MANEKKPNWDIGATATAAINAGKMCETYLTKLEGRVKATDAETLKLGGAELRTRHSGQATTLTAQKANTLTKSQVIALINSRVISIHDIVIGGENVTPDIKKAYGVGVRIARTADGVTGATNIVSAAYTKFTAWSNDVGIIKADITELTDLLVTLSKAVDDQDDSTIARKLRTMDKTVLHLTMEKLITKVSTVGYHVFAISNPPLARLFANLIPGSSGGDDTTTSTDTTTTTKTA
jgi:hypothetical protein